MRARLPLVVAAALITGAAATSARSATAHVAAPTGHTPEAEVTRIRLHFDSVLTELRARDVASLGAAERQRRFALLEILREYRDAGVFPSNHDFPGQRIPYFVDRRSGTLCAVAHLMASTGQRDMVERVARMDNNVWVAQLAGDAEFERWLDEHGLTLAEAARIQVPYEMVEAPAPSSGVGSYTATSLALGSAMAASIWNASANRRGESRAGNIAGIAAGVLALGAGTGAVGERPSSGFGTATAVAGATSILLSTRSIVRHRQQQSLQRAAQREGVRTTVSPLIPLDGSGGGVSLNVRF